MISTLAVAGYRSLRELHVALGRLTVVTGANGAGKSSLYRSLRLLADCARGGVVSSLAREGGLPSVLWAGPGGSTSGAGGRRRGPVSVRVGYASDGFGYLADLGLPSGDPGQSAFTLDPEVKRELVWAGPVLRPAATLLQRHGPAVQVRGDSGGFEPLVTDLASFESALAVAGDPARTPEVLAVRDQVRSWRFYDTFRTDAAAPARTVQIGTRTLALADDGSDLAAALQTIAEIGVAEELDACVDDAFPGSRLQVVSEGGRFDLTLHQPGLLRPLRTAELSDGTLRYLLWVAALLSPRPGELVVCNEPETSLHPDLLPALARLITRAAARTQVVVVTHDARLADLLDAGAGTTTLRLEKQDGETRVAGAGLLDAPPWTWGNR
ncbi:AAA family ATPase [Microlunatus capsulatus]|uniref:ATPase n=1 Tax=Microlunatus capsulatus TaxID=99117 RepID=A0ABS4ZDN5_9ACTN|nr:AAA family ATPase [Microlunatus capsulatus]MBP2419149.1 putative ATPase [Microlunatus capsulatus]